ncbi:MAG: alpha-amylase family glycosyl hydrolase [Melioribacteraceae bacterium]|nr:alpha-amylase family glycosyl hydrolase [Melioribacteraceae bacterium]
MVINPKIYEINIRLFLRKFETQNKKAKLLDIPFSFWSHLSDLGINFVWLMGIWKTCDITIDKYCFEDFLINSYSKALKDWKREDVIGSPYSINNYELNENICTESELKIFRDKLHSIGIGLILDFIPNHYSSESSLIYTNPEIFLQVDESTFNNDNHTYFQPNILEKKFFAHGRDPFFPAWQDTVQVNICSNAARDFQKKALLKISEICDGVRCDMAMLALNNVFKNTWGSALSEKCKEQNVEFWSEIIPFIKAKQNNFLFIAEAYWDLEWQLQQLGFDFTYDKILTDRLKFANAKEIHDHLTAEYDYQKKSLRFIENHDEERAITEFGKEKSKAASVIISTIYGGKLFFDGQFEGKKIKIPVQLGREPQEKILEDVKCFYEKLLTITSHKVFNYGEWKLLEPISSWINNFSFKNILAWEWNYETERRIVVVNYSSSIATCRLKIDVTGYPDEFVIKDLLNQVEYLRSSEEIHSLGLYIELKPFHSHIFSL